MDLGVVGLGVMGENLILNILDKGYSVGVYNRTVQKTDAFIGKTSHKNAKGFGSLSSLVQELKAPRILLLMITAGSPVDALLKQLEGLIGSSDIVIDGGNSNYHDTMRRCTAAEGKYLFVGCGISGGEEGARYGPSIMPGGSHEAWPAISSILQKISAVDESTNEPCCEWIGPSGSGHLVKTVHNGIEYAEMQIIADFYQIFRGGLSPAEISGIFGEWMKSGTSGFLIEAVQDILQKKIDGSDCYLIDRVVDISEQKGTGKWTVLESFDTNTPTPVIVEAVTARVLSSMKEERVASSKMLPVGAEDEPSLMGALSVDEMRKGFLLCRALSYIQGFNLIKSISDANSWSISLDMLCRVWSNGCIIRSEFLKTLTTISKSTPFFHSSSFIEIAENGIAPLRKIVSYCTRQGVSIPCVSSSLTYYDTIRTSKSSGNMIQALRDYFGAHTLLLEGESERTHISWK
ncbi:6-phosphogluconate dehydrogenase [Nematocida minor]|uniref:6-phosphogluconate dehydrogenase n=1 Tax=Nematocida minor TaxID=1912983 RepID=UPI00221E444E|nr:6-phosphogluconate dehydrogenase [Nematocida minor]KAI5190681.1 6-phosphogluconate dehydrogenase [Nematocida minor]